MKITCIKGSPRKNANSSIIADKLLNQLKSPENEIKTFELNKLNYKGCQGCRGCFTRAEKCTINDDLQDVLESVRESDVMILASPVYYGDITSQAKAFVDRTYSYYVPDFLTNPNPSRLNPGKKMVMILSQGNPDEDAFNDIFPRYSYFFQRHAFNDRFLIRACGVREEGEVLKREDILQHVKKVGEDII